MPLLNSVSACGSILAVTLLPVAGQNALFDAERASLVGLPGVRVTVEELDEQWTKNGISEDALTTDAELRLRRSGVPVIASGDRRRSLPYLYINVHLLDSQDVASGVVVYSITVELHQYARSQVTHQEVDAATWQRGALGTIGVNNLRQVRDNVGDYVDRFINDYLAANPPPR